DRGAAPDRMRCARDAGIMVGAAGLVTMPYAWNILRHKAGEPLSLALHFDFIMQQAWTMVAVLGPVMLLAIPAIRRAIRFRYPNIFFLVAFLGVILSCTLVTRIANGGEYKFMYLLLIGVGPLVGAAW